MNKIFLKLAASAAPGASKLSDSESSQGGPRQRTNRRNTRDTTDKIIDELLGDPNMPRRPSQHMDASSASTTSTSGSMRNNRLLNFMRRHRSASTATAKKMRFDRSDEPPRKRRGRRPGSRYVPSFCFRVYL